VTKGIVELEQLSVNPSFIDVTDIGELRTVGASVDIEPSYYNVVIRLSPIVIQQLLQWLVTNDYIGLKGTLTVSIRGRTVYYG